LGYKRFRDFLADAGARGYIEVNEERLGDVAISVPGETQAMVEFEKPIRSDLWRAFVDWTPNLLRFYDLTNDQVVMIPEKPAPLEPERFRAFRDRLEAERSAFVSIKFITLPEQLEWMKRFAAGMSDPRMRELLNAALDDKKPVKTFVAVLRTVPDQLQRWHGVLRQEVRQVIEQWQTSSENLRQISIDRASSPTSQNADDRQSARETGSRNAEMEMLELVSRLLRGSSRSSVSRLHPDAKATQPNVDSPDTVELRAKVHAAIDRMSANELRELRLPVGYLFG